MRRRSQIITFFRYLKKKKDLYFLIFSSFLFFIFPKLLNTTSSCRSFVFFESFFFILDSNTRRCAMGNELNVFNPRRWFKRYSRQFSTGSLLVMSFSDIYFFSVDSSLKRGAKERKQKRFQKNTKMKTTTVVRFPKLPIAAAFHVFFPLLCPQFFLMVFHQLLTTTLASTELIKL